MMRILIFWWTILFGKFVGKDEFGNKYYVYRFSSVKKINKRWVLYKGIVEPSKVPDICNMWLRGAIEEFPKIYKKYTWQKSHLPNLTGTKFALKHINNKSNSYNTYSAWIEKR